jgi:phosphoribosyl-AMP cyclohydrolase / phosphoribosyl-ATP pyrophosphohydrolase
MGKAWRSACEHQGKATMSDSNTDVSRLEWAKGDGLLPAIVQHWLSGEVLMLGYMNAEALERTQSTGQVTFYSRSKQRLWTKGESSGHVLALKSIRIDCDADTLLVQAQPHGPTCHLGTSSCFGEGVQPPLGFLAELDALVAQRHAERPPGSYTTKLFDGGIRRMAQKVGEEGVETALAAVVQDDHELLGEAADLIFHLTVVLRARGLSLTDVVALLATRHTTRSEHR